MIEYVGNSSIDSPEENSLPCPQDRDFAGILQSATLRQPRMKSLYVNTSRMMYFVLPLCHPNKRSNCLLSSRQNPSHPVNRQKTEDEQPTHNKNREGHGEFIIEVYLARSRTLDGCTARPRLMHWTRTPQIAANPPETKWNGRIPDVEYGMLSPLILDVGGRGEDRKSRSVLSSTLAN